MLVHQIPARPAYLRVKVARHLTRVGAVALKNTVYERHLCDGAGRKERVMKPNALLVLAARPVLR